MPQFTLWNFKKIRLFTIYLKGKNYPYKMDTHTKSDIKMVQNKAVKSCNNNKLTYVNEKALTLFPISSWKDFSNMNQITSPLTGRELCKIIKEINRDENLRRLTYVNEKL